MNKVSLFDLTQISATLINQLIEGGGEITDQLAADLAENREQIENKAVAYAYTLDSIDAQINQLKEMKKQISEREKVLSGSKDRLKQALLNGLVVCDIKKIEGQTHRITVGKKRPFLKILDESLIPDKYFTRTISATFDNKDNEYYELLVNELEIKNIIFKSDRKIDKKELLDDLKRGAEIAGAEAVENDKQLYIK